ncbi:MAG TPA: tyrosine-type recombinase/integrase [Candidatus Acidoferrales bacterium]|nr:tyrosine-type recombinase/integrase [Candidatus Acidoferrales bacterium]
MPRRPNHDGCVYPRKETKVWWMHYRDRNGIRRSESTRTEDWQEAQKRLRERLDARDNNVLEVVRKGEALSFGQWADFFVDNYSKPPLRAEKTHQVNIRATKHLKSAFATSRLADITADGIELYLRDRLRQRVRIKSALGIKEKTVLQPATVHQEFRVLRRMLNVAVRKKLLPANPCSGVEFPVRVKGLFRPHYVSWSEQKRIERHAPPHLLNIVRIITETGLRVYKELAPMRKDQVDLANAVVWIPDSKTPNGIAEVPLTPLAVEAFRDQLSIAGEGQFLFPSNLNPTGHQKNLKTAWGKTLRRAKIPYFRIYDLRSTYATRLSAGGVADEWVTQLLRQGDSQVFKRYSQMKLQMKREALEKLNRHANEMTATTSPVAGTAVVQ